MLLAGWIASISVTNIVHTFVHTLWVRGEGVGGIFFCCVQFCTSAIPGTMILPAVVQGGTVVDRPPSDVSQCRAVCCAHSFVPDGVTGTVAGNWHDREMSTVLLSTAAVVHALPCRIVCDN